MALIASIALICLIILIRVYIKVIDNLTVSYSEPDYTAESLSEKYEGRSSTGKSNEQGLQLSDKYKDTSAASTVHITLGFVHNLQ